ncbi:MAG: hypothetical protein ACOC8N_08965, partial [Spirochaetota bacterium]
MRRSIPALFVALSVLLVMAIVQTGMFPARAGMPPPAAGVPYITAWGEGHAVQRALSALHEVLDRVSGWGERLLERSILERSILADAVERHREQERAVRLFLDERADLLADSSLLSLSWVEHLHREGILRGAVLLHRSETTRVGERFTPRLVGGGGFFIDGRGRLHYQQGDSQQLVFLDALIDTATLHVRDDALACVLHDVSTGGSLALKSLPESGEGTAGNGNTEPAPPGARSAGESEQAGAGTAPPGWETELVGLSRVRVRSTVGDGMHLLSVYPLKLGFHSLYLIGLIVLGILAILVVYLSAQFALAGRPAQGKAETGGELMQEKEEEHAGVIEEIDREISDLVEEAPDTLVPGKEPAAPEERKKQAAPEERK